MRRCKVSGFTLVELLVVITIIGILIGLLLPAVQAAREAARRLQCQNNLKQLSLAMSSHEQAHGYFPTGGWGYHWIGIPDRGFTNRQPGGWGFNILPYLEQEPLWALGEGLSGSDRRTALEQRLSTPLALFNCPSRRRAILYPNHKGYGYRPTGTPTGVARGDYAANLGSAGYWGGSSPSSLSAGDGLSEQQWLNYSNGNEHDGIIYRRSELPAALIRDGLSNTYLVGERYLNPDHYHTGRPADDDQNLYIGHDRDVLRGTWTRPLQDRPGVSRQLSFGSVHAGSLNMAMCDGSVRTISYSIDPDVHRVLGARDSGEVIDTGAF